MNYFDRVSLALTLLTAGAQGLILFVLVRRKLRSDFPIFFAYNAYAVFAGLALALAYALPRVSDVQYFYAYSAINAVLMVLEFGVMYELVVVALKPYGAIIDLGKMLFRWAGLFLLVAAGLTAFATVVFVLPLRAPAFTFLAQPASKHCPGARRLCCHSALLFLFTSSLCGF
jgi:hypothetical protein